MSRDRFWRRLPPLLQFAVLCVLLPGVVAHEYVHAITALFEGAKTVTFDWGRASVDLEWAGPPGRWTWIAPTVAAAGLGVAALGLFLTATVKVTLPELLYVWIQFSLFAFPSPNDIEEFQNATAAA